MPTLLEETEVRIELTDMLKRSPLFHTIVKGLRLTSPRSRGWHVMSVIKYCAVQAKLLKPGEPLEDELPLWMALGCAWEEFAASFYPEMVWQPGEFERDKVFGTPDGLSQISDRQWAHNMPEKFVAKAVHRMLATGESQGCLEEFKFTRKKAKHGDDILHDWMWMQQMSAYCGYLDTTLARLHVCYINGDYKPYEAKYLRYVILFDEQEIERTWKMIQKNKHKAVKE